MKLPDAVEQKRDLWIAGIVVLVGFLIGTGLEGSIISNESDTPTDSSQEPETSVAGENRSINESLDLVENISWDELEYYSDESLDVYYAPAESLESPNKTVTLNALDGEHFEKDESKPGGLYFREDRPFNSTRIVLYLNSTAQNIDLRTRFKFGDTEKRVKSDVRYYSEEATGAMDFNRYILEENYDLGQENEKIFKLKPPQETESVSVAFSLACPCSGEELNKEEVVFNSLEIYE